jgi:hypothetical protein
MMTTTGDPQISMSAQFAGVPIKPGAVEAALEHLRGAT